MFSMKMLLLGYPQGGIVLSYKCLAFIGQAFTRGFYD